MRKRPSQPDGTFRCPHCGAEVKAGSSSCPACGSDRTTGWSEGADVWGAGIPTGYAHDDDFDYDEYIKREFGASAKKPRRLCMGLRLLIVLIILAAIGLILLALLQTGCRRETPQEEASREEKQEPTDAPKPLPEVDPRAHDGDPKEVFDETRHDDPMAYFYGMHYSDASCGLSRRPYIPKHNDVLVPLFIRCLYNPNCHVRSTIVKELGLSGDARAVPAVIHALDDLGEAAEEALWRLRDERAVEPLIARIREGKATAYALDHTSVSMRMEAAHCLGWRRDLGRSRAALERAYRDDPAIPVRIYSACALVKERHDEDRFGFIVNHLKSRDLDARRAAAECICFSMPMTQRTVPIIIQILRDDDEGTASSAWEQLDKHLDDGTITYALEHKQWKALADEYETLWERVKGDWKKK